MASRSRPGKRGGEAEAVAVVGAHHAAVSRSFLADDQVGAGRSGEEGYGEEEGCEEVFHVGLRIKV